jgi:hypothetical protein
MRTKYIDVWGLHRLAVFEIWVSLPWKEEEEEEEEEEEKEDEKLEGSITNKLS